MVNYSAGAAGGGVVLTVRAGIGYDVDWRTVHRLMHEAAAQTEHILTDPAPQIWQKDLGDYAVEYELRACDQPAGSHVRRSIRPCAGTFWMPSTGRGWRS